ncbi:spore coat protein U domain-containing protein [Paraburkholderia sp. ZP32-5]|uniref:spore coat protein U domain-containing protein n=1 Tax=Paraburkholderia sp. ZP32-5 TaxID=2883245 RepID=UPI001F1FCCD3|nr:spore coat U domain-containing protein [Paraburkholderia sp. ZP32-5]
MMRVHVTLAIASLLAMPIAAIAAGCTVTATALNFGIYNPLASANDDSTGTLDVECPGQTVTYTVAAAAGNGTFTERQMLAGSQALAYNVYIDTQRSKIWGDGTGATSVISGSYPPASGSGALTFYGRINARQTGVVAGSGNTFTDSLAVTVTF